MLPRSARSRATTSGVQHRAARATRYRLTAGANALPRRVAIGVLVGVHLHGTVLLGVALWRRRTRIRAVQVRPGRR